MPSNSLRAPQATTLANKRTKRALLSWTAGLVMAVIGCTYTLQSHAADHATDGPRVRLTTSMGDIVLQLDAKAAPKTVANFLQYVNNGHYNGTIFHRVIDGFMVQGGGFTTGMQQKPTLAPIRHEGAQVAERKGPLNEVGTIAMARTQNPHSATAQFFINVAKNRFLDYQSETTRGYGYVAFGRVIEGQSVVDAIKKVPTGASSNMPSSFPRDVPQTPIIIKTATLEK